MASYPQLCRRKLGVLKAYFFLAFPPSLGLGSCILALEERPRKESHRQKSPNFGSQNRNGIEKTPQLATSACQSRF
jgi:hypothetical protein